MSRIRTSSLLFGVLVLSPALAFAAPQGQTPPPSKTSAPKAAPAPAAHATNGVVKSVDATSLVITHPSGKEKGKEMTFVLNTSTQTKGTVAVGSAVEVRYKTMGTDNIAAAVTVQTKKK